MDNLKIKSDQLLSNVSIKFERYLSAQIDWKWRLNGILGARGTGKTTLLLQQLKQNHGTANEAIYISLDDLYFVGNSLVEFVQQFRNKGGRFLYIDEVHKYKNWALELKNLYDTYSDLFIVFTGSSIIDILKQNVDLSRRAIVYYLQGFSFREYLSFTNKLTIKAFSINDIASNHSALASEIIEKINPLVYFDDYLKSGYYPFFIESKNLYFRRLEQTLNQILESDMNFIDGYDTKNTPKIKQLLYILSMNVPFKPNIVKLSEKTGIHRNTLVTYIHYLEKAQIINAVYPSGISTSILQKPEKIYLNNTNLSFMLAQTLPDKGNLRETFFLNQVKAEHKVKIPKSGDFEIDEKYIFEIGGKSKTSKQIQNEQNAFIVSDDILIGAYNKIPLWLFGFLY
ncbi:MAG TPA: AAA family ATPase [Bacteroidales bacterium]|nr:MAG: AAA family ATPase [Bacteroidetes bacterium GWF2_33_38]OFY88880.1 MAG: AAA family ATPase [Bacteroidetes bacterium RIFOXYA2_FULL_33_7]HBF89017.1 AAA family ATPase [Bacteroidales bacterium]